MSSLERIAHVQQTLETASTEAGSTQGQPGFERRVAWLEEDVAVLHRRLRDECNEGGSVGASGDSGLRALVARLDGELSAERRSRESLEARIVSLEDSIRHERKERETQLRSFSSELETTMRGLIERIDDGLSLGATAMAERTNDTEDHLRRLILRVDEGLSAGAAALQDTLISTGAYDEMQRAAQPELAAQTASRPARQVQGRVQVDDNRGQNEVLSDQLRQSYDHLRQEQQRYTDQQRHANGQRPGAGPPITQAVSVPVQVAGSGIQPGQPRLVGQQGAGYVQRSAQGSPPLPGGMPSSGGNRR